MVSKAIALSVRQLLEPATLRLVAVVAAISTLLFVVVGVGLYWGLNTYVLPRWTGQADSGTAAGMALVITLLAGWFLFRAVAMLVMGLFTDAVIASVEDSHYPQAAALARPVPLLRGLSMGIRSALRAIGWNLLASPAYILLAVTGVGTLALALVVNAVLLARDFELMVVARHPEGALMPLSRTARWTLGLASSALFLMPFVNLLAPVFGAALAVHLVHVQAERRA